MKILKVQETVTFELYNCIGIVLTVLDGKSFKCQEHPILTFDSASKAINSRTRAFQPSNNWVINNVVMYQMLIGNHKAWLGHSELERAIDGDSLP